MSMYTLHLQHPAVTLHPRGLQPSRATQPGDAAALPPPLTTVPTPHGRGRRREQIRLCPPRASAAENPHPNHQIVILTFRVAGAAALAPVIDRGLKCIRRNLTFQARCMLPHLWLALWLRYASQLLVSCLLDPLKVGKVKSQSSCVSSVVGILVLYKRGK